ncbi:MAG TPA: glucokinase [Burkholderiales bacterium]|nr:glucokinase [Burkholderiales bacterium]
MILAGDIGGTNARIATFAVAGGRLKLGIEHVYPTHQYPNLESALREFLKGGIEQPAAACFGIAGPVRNGRAEMPNLGWVVDATSLAKEVGIERVAILNDLEANAYGVASLEDSDFVVLNAGAEDASGNAAVVSAGTGLGEAGLYFDGRTWRPFACEGGHADFAPADELQTEMVVWLRKQFGHVSWERVLSGQGILNIYRFLRESGRAQEEPWLVDALKSGDPAATIVKAAIEKKSALCEMTLQIFISAYGAEAANLALKIMATGGIFIGGGIAPRILSLLTGPAFMNAFVRKGRMGELLERIPVKVILNDSTALIGAARAAALSAGLI